MTILIRPTLRSVFVIPIKHIDSVGWSGEENEVTITTLGGAGWTFTPPHEGYFDDLVEKLEMYHAEKEGGNHDQPTR